MFWANTSPRCDASTDLGEMRPPIVATSLSRVFELGGPDGTRTRCGRFAFGRWCFFGWCGRGAAETAACPPRPTAIPAERPIAAAAARTETAAVSLLRCIRPRVTGPSYYERRRDERLGERELCQAPAGARRPPSCIRGRPFRRHIRADRTLLRDAEIHCEPNAGRD